MQPVSLLSLFLLLALLFHRVQSSLPAGDASAALFCLVAVAIALGAVARGRGEPLVHAVALYTGLGVGLVLVALVALLTAADVAGTWGAGVTLGVLAVLLAGVCLAQHARGRGQRWAAAGMCEECGYDLRESFDGCPECWAAIPEEVARRRRIRAAGAARAVEAAATRTSAVPPATAAPAEDDIS